MNVYVILRDGEYVARIVCKTATQCNVTLHVFPNKPVRGRAFYESGAIPEAVSRLKPTAFSDMPDDEYWRKVRADNAAGLSKFVRDISDDDGGSITWKDALYRNGYRVIQAL